MRTFEVRRVADEEFGTFRWAIWNRLTNEEVIKSVVSKKVALKKARVMNSY
jgi:hypothetical protein